MSNPACLLSSLEAPNPPLHAVYTAIQKNLTCQGADLRAGVELLVVCAETSLKHNNLDVANKCLETYFLEMKRYGSAGNGSQGSSGNNPVSPVQVCDQFLCRAYYALALLVSEKSKDLKGTPLVNGTLESIRHLIKGLEIATSNSRYLFLVYNGSVHHWHVSKPLQRPQTRAHLLPSMEKVMQALDKVPGQEEWKVRNLMNLALCLTEGKRPGEESSKTLLRAYEMATAAGLGAIQKEVAMLQVHLTSEAGAPAGKSPAAAPAKKGATTPAGASTALDEEGALRLIQAVITGKPEATVAEVQLKEAVSKVDPNPEGSAKGANLKPVARAAWAAAVIGLPELAEKWASRAAVSQELGPRIWSEMTRVLLGLRAVSTESLLRVERSAMRAHTKAMDLLEDIVNTFSKIRDIEGVHEASRLIWNTGLPLMQPDWHHHCKASCRRSVYSTFLYVIYFLLFTTPILSFTALVTSLSSSSPILVMDPKQSASLEMSMIESLDHGPIDRPPNPSTANPFFLSRCILQRTFNSAARALEVLMSPLHKLRVQLHLEAAKCDVAEDSLIKASQEVRKALLLDYISSPEEQERFQLERPLDRYLEPLNTALALRTAVEPVNTEEEAVLLIERSKESRNPAIKRDLLARAIAKLGDLPLLQPPVAGYTGRDRAAMQLDCRRRCVVWAELIHSAASSKMEDVVRTAAPYCLHPHWTPEVDREMVLLQAQVSYLEAEACASLLKSKGKEILPPLHEVEALLDPETGLRLASNNDIQLQELFLQAVLRGMKFGLSIKEDWIVINGAAMLWNTYLRIMHQHRYAELLKALEASVELLLQLEPGQADGALVCGVAEAYAKAIEHHLLLRILIAEGAKASHHGRAAAAINLDGGASFAATAAATGFRFKETPCYEVLPVAKVKTAQMDARAHPAAIPVVNSLLPKACKACEVALSRAGNAQSQSLYESYTRLQQLRGVPVALPAGAPVASEQTSRVVGIIESVSRVASSGEAAPPSVQADIKSAMQILSLLPVINVELWAKLARAAAAAAAWPLVIECARAAAASVSIDVTTITSPEDVPVNNCDWFWLATAELVHGQAILSLVNKSSQSQVTQLSLRQNAITHYVAAARMSAFVKKGDLAEASARLAWNAAIPFMSRPLLRCSLISSFAAIVSTVNALGTEDREFQVLLNCLLLECLASAKRWMETINACDEAARCIPNKRLLRPVLTWKAVCLAQISGGNQHRSQGEAQKPMSASATFNASIRTAASHGGLPPPSAGTQLSTQTQSFVQAEMFKIKEYIPEFQGHTWAVLSHHSAARYDQMFALQKSIQAVNAQPWVKTYYLGAYSEWLIGTGMNDNETVEDVLLAAADTIMEFDMGEEDGEDDLGDLEEELDKEEEEDDEDNPFAADRKRDLTKRKMKKRLNLNRGEATLDPNKAPSKLTATLLERFVRIFVMLSQVANTADDLTDYLLTAQHYATRMVTSAIIAAHAIPSRRTFNRLVKQASLTHGGTVGEDQNPPAHQLPSLPDTLAAWGTFDLSNELFEKLAADKGILAINRATLPEAELTVAYIDLLVKSLIKRGYDVHVLPLLQLQRMIVRLAIVDEGMYHVSTLNLVQAMDTLGMAKEASFLEKTLGSFWEISESDILAAKENIELQELVRAASTRLGPQRYVPTVGRLSFLGGAANNDRRQSSLLGNDLLPTAWQDKTRAQEGGLSSYLQQSVIKVGEDLETLHPDKPVPQWLEEAALQMRANDQKLDSGGLLAGAKNALILQPWSLHDTWLQKGSFLMSRGHYAQAKDLLLKARSHARVCCDSEKEARSLLFLSRCESRANNFNEAIQLLQAAQQLGGDYDFWQASIITYVDCRLAAPHTTTLDAREALQGGIAMFSTIARDDRAAEKAASEAGAALKVHLSKLLLHDMVNMRSQGVFDWKKHYDTAVTLCNQAIASLAAREAGIPHIEALLHQAQLLMEEPAPAKDIRPRFKRIDRVLSQAEEMASKFVLASVPRDLPSHISLPVSRLLAKVRRLVAELRLLQAKVRDDFAAADRDKARPGFPIVSPPKAPKVPRGAVAPPPPTLAIDETVIVDFIDEMDEQEPPFQSSLLPEDMALTLAVNSSVTGCPLLRVKGLLLSGQCLLYKFLGKVPEHLHPWPEKIQEKVALQKRRGQRKQRKLAAHLAEGTDEETDVEDVGEDAQQMALQVAEAESLRQECEATLLDAIRVALKAQAWEEVRMAALELARSYGRMAPNLAVRYLALSGSALGVTYLRDLMLKAAPKHQPEALAIRQMQLLQETLPVPDDSHHYSQTREALAVAGISTPFLDLGDDPEVAKRHVDSVPGNTRVLMIYISPDRSSLYFAAIVPKEEEVEGSPSLPNPTSTKDKGKGKDAPPQPSGPAPVKCIIEEVPFDYSALDALRAGLRSYRRDAEKQIRESLAIHHHASNSDSSGYSAAKAKLKKAKVAKVQDPKAGKGKKGAVADPPPQLEGDGDVDGGAAASSPIFPPSINEEWRKLVESFEQLIFQSLSAVIKKALPEVPVLDEAAIAAAAAAAAATKKKASGQEEVKGPTGHKLVLILDPDLTSLPFESLPYLRTNCSSVIRSPSLHMMHASLLKAQDKAREQQSPDNNITFDLNSLTYIVDSKHEGSSQEDAVGPYSPPIIPTFQSSMLTEFKDWKGLLGTPNRVPSDAELLHLLASAQSLLFVGMGRFLSYVPPRIISSLDLRGCDVAILLSRVNNAKAHQQQLYLDNRKTHAERQLETPTHTAEMLLIRGVKMVVTNATATTAKSNLDILRAIFSSLSVGNMTVAEAVWSSLLASRNELEHVSSNLIVMGLDVIPTMTNAPAKKK